MDAIDARIMVELTNGLVMLVCTRHFRIYERAGTVHQWFISNEQSKCKACEADAAL